MVQNSRKEWTIVLRKAHKLTDACLSPFAYKPHLLIKKQTQEHCVIAALHKTKFSSLLLSQSNGTGIFQERHDVKAKHCDFVPSRI